MKPYHQWRPHPWHGLDIGKSAPEVVNAYIEMTPFDLVKYEVDKDTGYLMVDGRSAHRRSRRRYMDIFPELIVAIGLGAWETSRWKETPIRWISA